VGRNLAQRRLAAASTKVKETWHDAA
jgi:hypothetical protein